jgi:dTDP-4-dehydrorhamnose 3,5-epimerase
LPLGGAYLIEPEPAADGRGFFARVCCRREFEARGIHIDFVQCNVSFNRRRGALRGLHYQAPPFGEPKVVRCTRGAMYDVVVDVRPGSPTFGRWAAAVLTAENRRMLFAPPGMAHGFQALRDDTEVFYLMGEFYRPEVSRGLRWDDPALAIAWPPCPRRIISPRDLSYPDFDPVGLRRRRQGRAAPLEAGGPHRSTGPPWRQPCV